MLTNRPPKGATVIQSVPPEPLSAINAPMLLRAFTTSDADWVRQYVEGMEVDAEDNHKLAIYTKDRKFIVQVEEGTE